MPSATQHGMLHIDQGAFERTSAKTIIVLHVPDRRLIIFRSVRAMPRFCPWVFVSGFAALSATESRLAHGCCPGLEQACAQSRGAPDSPVF